MHIMSVPEDTDMPAPAARSWLLLIHQLAPKPAYMRVKIWRRLRVLGAISVKNAVYVLPASEQALEDFHWLLREVKQSGGEGMICDASLIDGLNDGDVRALFDAARNADYEDIARELRDLSSALASCPVEAPADSQDALRRLRRRHAEVSRVDFFGASGQLAVEAMLCAIGARLGETASQFRPSPLPNAPMPDDLKGRIWVTRQGVHVDRIACAWLVRRFIDPEAQFKFVAGKRYDAVPGEVRFDMFDAEFTHVGDRCTFETLLERIGLDDAALRFIAEVVHDIDLKDDKFGREETAGIAHVIAGLCASQGHDDDRIARGLALFDDLYAYFGNRKDQGKGRKTTGKIGQL